MITVESKAKVGDGKFQIDFNGLSTDTKPTEAYEGMEIANGSTFMDMDEKKIYFYDEDGKGWV